VSQLSNKFYSELWKYKAALRTVLQMLAETQAAGVQPSGNELSGHPQTVGPGEIIAA